MTETDGVMAQAEVCFTVLRGTVGAADHGEAVSLGGPQQRRLLAALLAEHDSIVSADRLVESIWPEGAAPDGARRTVMSYVSRLRASIGGDHLVTRDNGYALVLDGASYDAADFEQALARARSSQPGDAVAAYDGALSYWSGRAFGDDADEWWLRPVAARLEELRLVALEERAECLIDDSRHAEAVADLERLVAEQPLRERFVELLMRALYLGGRQAEALRAFRRFHDYLADETGLPPSDALVDLDRRITLGDPSLAPASGPAVPGYELGEIIGEGAFGAVYRALQPSVGREVAVKVVRADLADDPRFVQRFEAEAQLVARLEHPHVVPLYDFWRRPGGAFLVFRLLRGGSLSDRIADGPLPLADVTRLVEEISGALAAAHALGVVHRDVKPANVLFDESGNSYLADFGIAVLSGADDDLDLRSAGSPLYASPEQARDGKATAASDLYALGVVAWEALTGAPPFAGSTTTEVFRAKFTDPVPSLEGHADVPTALDAVLQRATAPRAEHRYASVSDFAQSWRLAVLGTDTLRTTGRLAGEPAARTVVHTIASMPAVGGNPYKGLRAFREADAADFYGRGELVARLVAAVEAAPFVAVVGPSGSGKSSLVQAGVVPEFRRRGALVVSMVPGSDPITELEAALRRVATTDDDSTMRTRLSQTDGLLTVATDLVAEGEQLVIVVDQFEELWTSVDSDATRDHFVELLATAATPQQFLRVIVTLRADLYDRPLQDALMGPVVSDATFAVTPMTSSELQDAIVAPAERVGVRFEPGLVATIVSDVVSRPGALPLLQFTLTELYEQRSNATVTAHTYRDLGGIGGALASRAEQLYGEMNATQQADVRSMFTQLVTAGDESDDLRRRATMDELAGVPPEVVDRYRANRLLVTDHHPITREPTIEVAHEALLREWPRLRDWIDEDRDAIRVRRAITQAATDWDAHERDESILYRGPRLSAAHDVARQIRLAATEREFLVASDGLANRERAEAELRARTQARQNRRLRRSLVAVAVILVVALVFGGYAISQRNRADQQRNRARAATVSAELDRAIAEVPALIDRNRTLALLLAAQVERRRPGPAARGALLSALIAEPRLRFTLSGGHDGYAWMAPFPGERRIVALGRSGGDVWDLAERRLAGSFSVPGAQGVAVSPDGRLIAAGSKSGTVTFWNAATLRPDGIPLHVGAPVADVAFVGDGSRLAVALGTLEAARPITAATTTRLWDVAARVPTGVALGGHTTTVNALARNPDGRLIAAGDNGGHVMLHAAGTGAVVADIDVQAGVRSVAFSPDGRRLAVGTFGTGFGVVYDVSNATSPVPVSGKVGKGVAVSVGFDASGTRVAVAGDTAAEVFDASKPGFPRVGSPLDTQHGAAQAAFLQGLGLVVSGYDGTMTAWDLTGRPAMARLLRGAPRAGGVYSPDGSRLALVDNNDGVQLYSVPDQRRIASLSIRGPGVRGPYFSATPAAFSADGRILAIGDRFGNVELFDARTGRARGGPIVTAAHQLIIQLAFSPDGRTIAATANGDPVNGASVIDLATRRSRLLDPPVPFALTATFRPDGRRLVVTSGGGGAGLYPISNGAVGRGKVLAGVGGTKAESAAFSPDGSLLAVGSQDGTLGFYDATTLRRIGDDLPLSKAILATVVFSRDGRFLLVQDTGTAHHLVDVRRRARVGEPTLGYALTPSLYGTGGFSPDGRTMVLPTPQGSTLWDLDSAHWLGAACALAGRDLTRVEWNDYFSAVGPYHSTCSGG